MYLSYIFLPAVPVHEAHVRRPAQGRRRRARAASGSAGNNQLRRQVQPAHRLGTPHPAGCRLRSEIP